jgi:hypothetical protein
MVQLTRCLDLLAATILEVTVVYVDVEFADVVAPDARFWVFVLVTMHLLWRGLQLAVYLKPVAALPSRKLWRNFGLTPFRESVFSQFCYRKDG